MNQIKCPHCGKEFTIDETSYSDIVSQIKNKEFQSEVHKKLEQFRLQNEKDIVIEKTKVESDYKEKLSNKEQELNTLKQQLKSTDDVKKLEVINVETKFKEELSAKEMQLLTLQSKLEVIKKENELETQTAIAKRERQLLELTNQIELEKKQNEIEKSSLKGNYEEQLKLKEEEIAFYKDFKARQSTKMVGESLEMHCEIEFNRIRAMAFPNAKFGKDNDAKSGSKGDYIYREYDEYNNEIISIMFEMKNQNDQTATKRKMNIFSRN